MVDPEKKDHKGIYLHTICEHMDIQSDLEQEILLSLFVWYHNHLVLSSVI